MKGRVSYSHEFIGDAACRAAALAAVQKKQGEGAGMDRFLRRGGGDKRPAISCRTPRQTADASSSSRRLRTSPRADGSASTSTAPCAR